jgi:hypothetical protein
MANKYGARKTEMCGIWFDSKREAYRYLELLSEQQNGEISDLTLQPRFMLIPGFTDSTGKWEIAAHYTADFQYVKNGKTIVEDVKSAITRSKPDYVLRRKLFKTRYPELIFREVA